MLPIRSVARAAAAVTIVFFCFHSRLLFVENERQIKIIKTLTVYSTQSVRRSARPQ